MSSPISRPIRRRSLVDEIAEAIQFLEWLTNNNFTLLGVRDYQLTDDESDYAPHAEGGLGLLRERIFRCCATATISPRLPRRSWNSARTESAHHCEG